MPPEVLSKRVRSPTDCGGGISTISYCAAPEDDDELEFLRSLLLLYSGEPEDETAAVEDDGGGGDELQLGTVPSLKPIQTAQTTGLFVRRRRPLFSSAARLLLKCEEERESEASAICWVERGNIAAVSLYITTLPSDSDFRGKGIEDMGSGAGTRAGAGDGNSSVRCALA